MFDVWCPRHRARVLLFPPDIEALVNTPAGIEVRWRCSCGERGVWLTGRRPQAEMAAANRSSSP